MTRIVKAQTRDCELLADIGKQSFLDAHGKSAAKEDIDAFVALNYSRKAFVKELSTLGNIYQIIYFNNQAVGFSKIVLNSPNTNIDQEQVTKLDRLYLLKEFYGYNLGDTLMSFNIELSKQNNQKGIWLAVWIENKRAINFYLKNGFTIVGSYDFKISGTHVNPNHIMYLRY